MSTETTASPTATDVTASPKHGFWWKFGHVFVALATGFVSLFGDDPKEAEAEAAAMGKAMLLALKSAPGQIAQQVVAKYASPTYADLTNTQKREQAIADVISLTTEKAISLAETDAVLLVQFAYKLFSGQLKQSDTDPTTGTDTGTQPITQTGGGDAPVATPQAKPSDDDDQPE